MKKRIILAMILLISDFLLFSDEANIKLRNLKIGDIAVEQYNRYFNEIRGLVWGLESSYLDNETPYIKPDINGEYDCNYSEYEEYVYHEWLCKYDVKNAYDGKLDTSWVEGVEGDGIGETIIIPCWFLDFTKKIEIFTGYAKTKDLWEKNNRPRNVRLFILKCERDEETENLGAAIDDIVCKDITVIDEQYATLKDVYGWQELSLDKSILKEPSEERQNRFKNEKDKLIRNEFCHAYGTDIFYFVGIQILSVYEGTKYQDTCISEVRFEYR